MHFPPLLRATLLPALLAPTLAFATNGYFSHGYGVKSQGLAGVGIALPQDGLAAATNPADTAFVGNRFDIGATWFRPDRGAELGLAYTHGFKKTVHGSNAIPAAYGGGDVDIHLAEDILGVAYAWKFQAQG